MVLVLALSARSRPSLLTGALRWGIGHSHRPIETPASAQCKVARTRLSLLLGSAETWEGLTITASMHVR